MTITSNYTLPFEATKTVFSNWGYVSIAAMVTAVFWIPFSFFDQLLFFSPVLAFYMPKDVAVDFVVSNIAAVLLGGARW